MRDNTKHTILDTSKIQMTLVLISLVTVSLLNRQPISKHLEKRMNLLLNFIELLSIQDLEMFQRNKKTKLLLLEQEFIELLVKEKQLS
jgi:hypothetical protein